MMRFTGNRSHSFSSAVCSVLEESLNIIERGLPNPVPL